MSNSENTPDSLPWSYCTLMGPSLFDGQVVEIPDSYKAITIFQDINGETKIDVFVRSKLHFTKFHFWNRINPEELQELAKKIAHYHDKNRPS